MKRVYLAIPYSGMEESSYRQANNAMIKILEAGHCVYSPITSSHVTTLSPNEIPRTWEFWWNIDRQFVDWAEEIWVLVPEEGIESVVDSRGVTDEIIYATDRAKSVRYFYIKNNEIVFEDLDFFFKDEETERTNYDLDEYDR